MMYISTTHNIEHSWHVGEPVPVIPVEHVVEVQADLDELAHVYALLPRLARANNVIATWMGDTARCVYLCISSAK